MDDEDKKVTAYHEAGHALVLELIPETEPLHKVTIIPRGIAYLGATMQLPEKDRYHEFKAKIVGEITGMMGGRVAEETIFGDITAGARSDIKIATDIAHQMVCEWGMSEKLGPMTFGHREEHIFLGREISRSVDYSEATAVKIDAEVNRIIIACYQRARDIITTHRDKLEVITRALLEREVLTGEEVKEIVKTGELTTKFKKKRRPRAPRRRRVPAADSPRPEIPPRAGQPAVDLA